MGTSYDFIIVQDQNFVLMSRCPSCFCRCYYGDLRDLVLRTVDKQIISPVFQYIRGNLMLVIVNLAI